MTPKALPGTRQKQMTNRNVFETKKRLLAKLELAALGSDKLVVARQVLEILMPEIARIVQEEVAAERRKAG